MSTPTAPKPTAAAAMLGSHGVAPVVSDVDEVERGRDRDQSRRRRAERPSEPARTPAPPSREHRPAPSRRKWAEVPSHRDRAPPARSGVGHAATRRRTRSTGTSPSSSPAPAFSGNCAVAGRTSGAGPEFSLVLLWTSESAWPAGSRRLLLGGLGSLVVWGSVLLDLWLSAGLIGAGYDFRSPRFSGLRVEPVGLDRANRAARGALNQGVKAG
jgi:hypothetical protein